MISIEEAFVACPIVAILRGLEPERAEEIAQALFDAAPGRHWDFGAFEVA